MKTRERVENFTVELARDAYVEGIESRAGDAFSEIRITSNGKVLYLVSAYGGKELYVEREIETPDETQDETPKPAAGEGIEF